MSNSERLMSKPLFVSFHTPDDWYEYQAKRLKESLVKFGLEHHIECLNGFEGWAPCCFFKAHFILKMLNEHSGQDIIWLDADAQVAQYPALLDSIRTDIAYVRNGNKEVIASMLYFKNNDASRHLLKGWMEANEMFPNNRAADQENLGRLVNSLEAARKITGTELPSSYCFEDGITREKTVPVIYQWIASRVGKHLKEWEGIIP
jgi:hypothetical protein